MILPFRSRDERAERERSTYSRRRGASHVVLEKKGKNNENEYFR